MAQSRNLDIFLTVWGFMVLHCVSYGVVLHPLMPVALLVSLAAPFLLLNWWWSSLICEMFGIPPTGVNDWLAEPA